jgi:hypothetical protein
VRPPNLPHRPRAARAIRAPLGARLRAWARPDVLLLTALLAAVGIGASARAADRAELEAAIVYNILLFVDWPADAAPAPGAPLVLCVDPDSALALPLRSLNGRAVRGARLEVRELTPSAAAQGCNALFVGAFATHATVTRHAVPKGAPVLVIDDLDPPPSSGAPAAIHLENADGRIAFDVNLAAAHDSRLQISSRLLRLARKVIE